MTTAQIDPFGATAAGARMAALAELAGQGPVVPITLPNGLPAWLVTDYAGARQALNDDRLRKVVTPMMVMVDRLRPELGPAIANHMLRVDGSDHARLRRLVGAAFTRRRMEGLEPHIREIAADLLDGLAAEGPGATVDLLARYAYPLPMTVICELLGIAPEHRETFGELTQTIMAGVFAGDEAFGSAMDRLIPLLRGLVETKRSAPADDLISALVAVRDGDDRLTEDELTSMIWVLAVAGHETTVNVIGNGVAALLAHPDQLARLHKDRDLLPGAIEELLRFEGPVQATFPVVAAERLELCGVTIEAGAIVVPALLIANRDSAHAPNPDVLDVGRDPSPHLAFGHGIHHCVGAPLARLEGRIALELLFARFGDLKLAVDPGQLVRRPSFLIHGFTELPVRLGTPTG